MSMASYVRSHADEGPDYCRARRRLVHSSTLPLGIDRDDADKVIYTTIKGDDQTMEETKTIFLGGTIGQNDWRQRIAIPALTAQGIPASWLFDPTVQHWDAEAQRREDKMKQTADYLLFYIGSPAQAGEPTANLSTYSLVELIMLLYDRPGHVTATFDLHGLEGRAVKTMRKTFSDLTLRFPDAPIFEALDESIAWLAAQFS